MASIILTPESGCGDDVVTGVGDGIGTGNPVQDPLAGYRFGVFPTPYFGGSALGFSIEGARRKYWAVATLPVFFALFEFALAVIMLALGFTGTFVTAI